MRSHAQKQRITDLERKCKRLEKKYAQLQNDRRELELETMILSAWCDMFAVTRDQRAAQYRSEHTCGTPEMSALLQLEDDLLQQLQQQGFTKQQLQQQPGPAPLLPTLLDTVSDTVAPLDDPTALFKDLVARPVLPEALTMTALDMAVHYRESVMAVAGYLHQLDGPFAEVCRPLDKIKARVDRHLHLLTSLVLAGRADVAEQLATLHLETLEPLGPEYDQAAAAAVVVPTLGLTEQQEDVITTGMSVYLQLARPITRRWQQLQQELADDLAGTSSSSQEVRSSCSTSSNPADLLQPSELTSVSRQQRLAQLQLVIHKRYWLHMAACAWFYGCTTWTQLAQLATRTWPMCPTTSAVVQQIQKQRQARLDKAASTHARTGDA